jgi:predicted transposase/invertase (TIGR01784 family)
MRKLLSPLADPIFKRIFGEEKDILISLINAIIELGDPVIEIEYLQPELSAEHAEEKNSIVDVRCKDASNRHFIVEMQIDLHKAFLQRVLFNACKVYSRQLTAGSHFENLQPVHCICITNANIDAEDEAFIQTYDITRRRNRLSELEGMQFHFIELPKFRKMSKFDLTNPLQGWMKFFTDPEYFSTMPIRHYETFEELKKAIELVDESNFTPEQLYAYDRYLDNIRTKKAIEDYIKERSFEAGKEEGIQITVAILKAIQEGHLTHETIALQYGISVEEVEKLAAAFN